MIESLITRSCTLVIRGDEDETDFGVLDPEEERIETLCYLEQKRREEDDDQGEFSESDWLACFRSDEEIPDTASALVVEQSVYEFVGAPWPVQDPELGRVSHIEATVRYTGAEEES